MDNKLPKNQNPFTPDTSAGQPLQPSPPLTPPEITPVSSSVVLPEPKERLPFWFYILFTVVAITFFFITFLLAKTLIERQNQSKLLAPTSIPEKVEVASPTVTPTPTDEYLESINKIGETDEISSIETDLNSTEISQLEGDLEKLETFVNP